jgi:hypothetical protein
MAASLAKASITPWSVVLRTSAGSRSAAVILRPHRALQSSDAALEGENE